MKHTKGPWTSYGGVIWSLSTEIDLSQWTNRICVIGSNLRAPEAEKRANAQLIAAAPELLEACKRALILSPIKDYSQLDPGLEEDAAVLELLSAINKAEGGAK